MDVPGEKMFKRVIFLLVLSLVMLNGCGNSDEKNHVYIDAVILKVNDKGHFLVETSKNIEGKIIKSELIFALDEALFEKDKFQVGDEITIDCNDIVSESYPGILDVVYGVELKE